MEWDYHEVRLKAWNTTFKRGWRAWFSLVAVCFLFSFIGASNSSQVYFVDTLDNVIGSTDIMQPGNDDIIVDYLMQIPWVRDWPVLGSEFFRTLADSISKNMTWMVRLLMLNRAYMARNPEEVFMNLVIVALITVFMRFFVQNVAVIGQNRYVMEARFSREVTFRRMLAPFHRHYLANEIWVMFRYRVALLLWLPTVVGWVYKVYQYRMVPYLLAENPTITWRDAREASVRMTEGFKMRMFLTQLSYIYISLLKILPLVGLMVAVPLEVALSSEFYFTLRGRLDTDSELLTEPAFGLGPLAVDAFSDKEHAYRLGNLELYHPREVFGPLPYAPTDLIYMFFAFCFAGWVWEVGLHFVQAHEFVNRGTMYGPWIPIYGVGGVGIICLLDRFKEVPERLFVLAIGLCAVLEYACSWVLDFMFNASYWDYKDMLFNVNGRICLAGLLAFGIGGLLGVYVVAPAVSDRVQELPRKLRYGLAGMLVAAFAADLGYCVFHGFNSGAGVGEDL